MSILIPIAALCALILSGWAILFWHYRAVLISLWREPVLRHPVLIIESDHWGPGPKAHGQQLHRIARILARHHDGQGHPAVMTLGIALALPDTERMKPGNYQQYYRKLLSPLSCPAICDVMRRGVASGIFSLQLNGLEYYWPGTLLWAIKTNPKIKDWLLSDEFPGTEALPAHLQSRWTDTRTLPSRPLPEHEIKAEAALEVKIFSRLFGAPPQVVVPPAFLWNSVVEKAWAEAGVRVIVTPGQRYEERDRDSSMMAKGQPIHNSQLNEYGQIYMVRDDYFEPALGHLAEKGLASLANKTRLARPTLLESHRFNFVDDPDVADSALHELDRLLEVVIKHFPDVLFMSTGKLAQGFMAADQDLIEVKLMPRLHAWLLRLRELPAVWRLAWLSGVIIPATVLYLATRSSYKLRETT